MPLRESASIIDTAEGEHAIEYSIDLVGPLTLGARLVGVTPKDGGQILMLLDGGDPEADERLAAKLDLSRSEGSHVTLVCVPAPPQWSRGIVKKRILRMA